MKKNYYLICVLLLAAFCTTSVATAQNYFGDFPVKADPKTVGNKLSKRLMETKHQLYGDRGIHYAEVCTWYGALRFAELTNNKGLIKQLRNRFELLFHLEKELLPPQHPNGLFYHAPDVPYYWGRGDGWMAVGMTELLFNLPKNDPNRDRIMKGYLLMMNNLKKYVNKDGLWNQLIDQPDFWTETSGSAMFTYAMILGVQNGWLDKEEFAPIARRAWLGLCNYIDDKNDLTEVCIGTGKKNSKQYYMDRPRIAGDYHGQAPMIWCAYALLNNK